MTELPDYWLRRPATASDEGGRAAIDRFLDDALSSGDNLALDYDLQVPKWEFLDHVARSRDIVVHGSGESDIAVFEPRAPIDLTAFGSQKAVFAAGDGIWAMFFAIADRANHPMAVTNACVQLVDGQGNASDPLYFFSVTREALVKRPWRPGTVYLLPRETFRPQTPIPFGEVQVSIPQLASPSPVVPLARLPVEPGDFPFLDQVRGHNDDLLEESARALQTGAPLPEG